VNVDAAEFRALRAELAGLTRAAMESLSVIARRCVVDEAVIEALCARAVEQDRAARPAARRRRGHLRPAGDDAS
jgi:hypothetical protein